MASKHGFSRPHMGKGFPYAAMSSGGWWEQYGDPGMALDFTTSRYMINGEMASSSDLTFTRASAGYAKNLAGTWLSFGSNVPRITDRGFLSEAEATNSFLNSAAPVTQTISLGTGTFTLWVEGAGSAAIAANTATGSGFDTATAGDHVTVTITGAGSVDVTITGSLSHAQLENRPYPTSKIDVVGTAVTRAADKLYRDMGAEFNAAAFSVIVRVRRDYAKADTGQMIVGLTTDPVSTDNDIRLRFRNLSNNFTFQLFAGGVDQYGTVDAGTELGLGVSQNVGFAFATNNGALYANGTQVSTDASITMPSDLAFLTFGQERNDSNWLDGYIERALLYDTRLSNAELAARTA